MIWRLARFELEIARRDRRAWWSLLCLAALVLLAFASVSLEAARGDADKRAVAAAERARWVGQGTKDPHSAAHYSIFAFKPSPPLVGLDPGATPFLGQTIWLEAHHQNDALYRPQQNASLLQRAGLADPAALILGFSPLIAFLFAFALVAQDRERGTLRLALGAARHPASVIQAKMLAIWSVMTLLLAAPVCVAALGLAAAAGRLDGDVLLRGVLWALLMSVYLALATAIGVTSALRAPNARIALAALFGGWILFALVLPRAASATIDMARPLPSSQTVRQQLLEAAPAYWSAEDAARQKAALLARYGVSRIEDVPNPRMAELDMVERRSHQVFDRVLGAFYDRVAAQDRLFATLGFLSPTVAAQSLSGALAGSDFSHHRDFIAAAERYRRDLVNRMNADGMAHRAHGDERHTNDARLWSQIPAFDYAQPRLGPPAATAAPALAALALWSILQALLLARTAVRLKP